MSKTARALKFPCPKCKAKPNKQCVMLGALTEGLTWFLDRPHHERFRALDRAERKAGIQPPRPPKKEAAKTHARWRHRQNMEVARSLGQFDSYERERLRSWLAEHGSILQ